MPDHRRLDRRAWLGANLIDQLGTIVRGHGAAPRSTAIVIDPALAEGPLGDRLACALPGAAAPFRLRPGEPTAAEVDRLAAWLRDRKPRAIVAVGGGSVLDATKLAAAVASGPLPSPAYACGATPLPPRTAPLIAVPTTAGTGSEATATAIYTLATGAKVWAWEEALRFDATLLDPTVTEGLPATLTAMTGADVLVHAIESLTNRRHDAQADAQARAALALGGRYLARSVADGGDLEARAGMLEAAYRAGLAIDRTGCALAHALGHALGAVLKVPHGRAVAVALAAILPVNAAAAPDGHAAAAAALGQGDGLPDRFGRVLETIGFGDWPRIGASEAERLAVIAAVTLPENRPMCDVNAAPLTAFDLPTVVGYMVA